MIHADPCVSLSYREERGLLKRWRENLDAGGRRGELLGLNLRVDVGCAHICSVCSDFVFLDVVERPFEPHTFQRVIVIFEEEFERAGGDPDFRVFHRESRFYPSPETFWEDLHGKRELGRSRY